MPLIYELFGFPVSLRDDVTEASRRSARCPFTDSRCDGGGNRYQTRITLPNDGPLRDFFNEDIDQVIPGVCSIDYGEQRWIVCPRRLMGFKFDGEGLPLINQALNDHERSVLREGGLPTGRELGVWPEVYLTFSDDDAHIKYHFDFVVAPLVRDRPLSEIFETNDVPPDAQNEVIGAARSAGLLSGQVDERTIIPVAPDVTRPFILEIMTASTSGSNRQKGTDIASAFRAAILGKDHQSPGINKRQVWGRMATQLFAKSALAEGWGGRTLWIVQDELLSDIENTTQLSMHNCDEADSSTVNFVWLSYPDRGAADDLSLQIEGYRQLAAGIDFSGDATCADILIPKVKPPKFELLKAVLRSKLEGRVRL